MSEQEKQPPKQAMSLKAITIANEERFAGAVNECWALLSGLSPPVWAQLNQIINAGPTRGEQQLFFWIRKIAGIGLMQILRDHVNDLDALQERWQKEKGKPNLYVPGGQ